MLVVRQEDHILPRIAKVAVEIIRHIFDVIDTPSEFRLLSEIVDPYQQRLTPSCTIRVLILVVHIRARVEVVWSCRGGSWGMIIAVDKGVRVNGGETLGISTPRFMKDFCCIHLVALRIVALRVRAVCNQSPLLVVSGGTVSLSPCHSYVQVFVYRLISSTVWSWWLLWRWRLISSISWLR